MTLPASISATPRPAPQIRRPATLAPRPAHLVHVETRLPDQIELTLAPEVIAAVERYKPRERVPGWERVKPFAQQVAARASTDAVSAQRVMVIVAPFVTWAVNEQGLPMTIGELFTLRVIEAYCASRDTTDATRATYRSQLVAVAEDLNPGGIPRRPAPIRRTTIKPPYSSAEMAEFRQWATGQNTDLRRRKAKLMVALCAGAGLRPNEFQLLRSDVVVDDQGIVITVRSAEPRDVPVLREWEPWILEALDDVPEDAPLWMSDGQQPNKSLLNAFTAKTIGKAPNSVRLRATWIVNHLAMGTPVKELMRAAGMVQFNNLHHYVAFVDEVAPAAYRSLLRGGATR